MGKFVRNIDNDPIYIEINTSLKLRSIVKEDAALIFNAINNNRNYLGKWLPFVALTKTIDDSEAFVDAALIHAIASQNYVYSIFWENTFTGLIGFRDTDLSNQKTEIGYWLIEKLQHKGIITLATKYLCRYAFTEMNLNRIQIRCAIDNDASRKIPERLGFIFEGFERDGELLSNGKFTDLAIYSLLKRDWQDQTYVDN